MVKKVAIIFTLVVLLMNGLYLINKIDDDAYSYNHMGKIDSTDLQTITLQKDDILEQKIWANDNQLYKIRLYLNFLPCDNNKYMDAYIILGLKDESGVVINEYKFEKVFFEDSYYIDLKIDTQKESIGREYTFYIKSYKSEKFSLSVNKVEDQAMTLYENGNKKNTSFLLKTFYKTESKKAFYYSIYCIISFLFLGLFLFLRTHKCLSIHNKYLLLATIIYLLSSLCTPTFRGNDEESHWARIYEISNGKMVSDCLDEWPTSKIPSSVMDIGFASYDKIGLVSKDYKEGNTTLVNMEYTSVYAPISYIPQIIGLKVGKIFSNKPMIWFYMARVFGTLFCLFCIYKAIKIIPFGKNILFLISLFPSTVKAITMLSADSLLIACFCLFLAKIMEIIIQKKDITKKDWLLLGITSIIIAISKLVYFPLTLILFLIPYNKKNSTELKKTLVLFFITLILTFFWNLLAIKSLTAGQGANTYFMLVYYMKNPLEFIQIIFYTFYHQIGNFISDAFGGDNQWYGTIIKDASLVPLFFFLCFCFACLNDASSLSKKNKTILSILLISTYLLISISLLITCTPVFYKEIVGIQGRYFIPLLPILYMVLPNIELKKKYKIDYSLLLSLVYLLYFTNYFFNFV